MGEADCTATRHEPERLTRFPRSFAFVEFTLDIELDSGEAADVLAAQVRGALRKEFSKGDTAFASLYELVIEETDVWRGSRHSRNKGTLKRRQGGTLREKLGRMGSIALILLNVASTDYTKIKTNFEGAKQRVEQQFNRAGHRINIRDTHYFPHGSGPARP